MFSCVASLAIVVSLSAAVFAAPAKPAKRQTGGTFTYYNLTTPLSGPCDLATGSDNNIWADTFLENLIVKVDAVTGELTEYEIPYTLGIVNTTIPLVSTVEGIIAGACVVRAGNDGRIYAATGVRNQFLRVNVTTGDIEVFNTGSILGNLQPFNDAWPGETGMYFSQTTANVISLFDYETTEITNYEVPTPLAGPLGMRIAADGALWFTEMLASKIGRMNLTDGTFMEFDLPLELATPTVMRAQTDDRYLYFTCIGTNSIGQIDIYTGETGAFTDPTLLATPIEDDTDSEGNVWFSTLTQNTLNYLTPSTGEFTYIDEPGLSLGSPILPSLPPAAEIAMMYHESDNTMWFTSLALNFIGRYQIPS